MPTIDLRPRRPEDALDDYSKPLKLLAKGLSFIDPLSGERRSFESQLSLL